MSDPNDASVRVLLADDHKPTRTSLRRRIERSARIIVVGEAAGGRNTLLLVERTPADVLLLDVAMSPVNGLEVMRRLSEIATSVRVLGLSNYSDPTYVFEMLAYGAAGYLLKEDAADVIVDAVRCVAAGARCQLSPTLRTTLRPRTSSPTKWPVSHDTPTEAREVIRRIAAGYPNEQVAELLNVPIQTVEAVITQMCKALAFRDRTELVAWGWRQGLVVPPSRARSTTDPGR